MLPENARPRVQRRVSGRNSKLVADQGGTGFTPDQLFRQLWDTQNPAPGPTSGPSWGVTRVSARLGSEPSLRPALVRVFQSHKRDRIDGSASIGMIAFQAEDGPAVARRLAERLKVVKYAVSLGKPHGLVFYLPTEDLQRTSFQHPPDLLARYRQWAGDGIFRLSIGLEAPRELIRDLDQALAP